MAGQKSPSISPRDLYAAIGTEGAPLVIDVRRAAAFDVDDKMIVGAIRRDPEEVEQWGPQLPSGRSVVVYCMHGHEVGLLALSLGLGANFPDDHAMLEHGMIIYDAFYAWCRSLQAETHGWNPELGR